MPDLASLAETFAKGTPQILFAQTLIKPLARESGRGRGPLRQQWEGEGHASPMLAASIRLARLSWTLPASNIGW